MCKFLSVIEDKHGLIHCLDWRMRKKCATININYCDSHAFLANMKTLGNAEPYNSYEINPWTKKFIIDSQLFENDCSNVQEWIQTVDMSKICPFISFEAIPKMGKAKKINTEDMLQLYNFSIVSRHPWEYIKRTLYKPGECAVIGRILKAAEDMFCTKIRNRTSVSCVTNYRDSLDAVYPLSMLKVKSWKRKNKLLFHPNELDSLKHFDINENPYGSAVYLWKRGLLPVLRSHEHSVYNSAGENVLDIDPLELAKYVNKIK